MDESNFAAGQVVTGFSYPVIALYHAAGTNVHYTDGMDLARGVSIDPDIETTGDDNTFSANNRASEQAQQRMRRCILALTVDGLRTAAEKLAMGLVNVTPLQISEGVTVNIKEYDDDQKIPYTGLGVIVRIMSNGNEAFIPWVYPKTRFAQFTVPAETEGEEIDWQTTELSVNAMRDDTPKHRWQRVAEPVATELEAYNVIRKMLDMELATELPIVVGTQAAAQTAQGEAHTEG